MLEFNRKKINTIPDFNHNRLDKHNVAVLLEDHHSSLTNLVQDFSPDDFNNNVLTLADAAKYFTKVCVSFPVLSAREEGYEVFIVTDASGTFNKTTRDAAWARMTQAGCQLMTWFGVACELHRDWRNDIEGLGTLFSNHLPSYRCLITSYMAGKSAAQK